MLTVTKRPESIILSNNCFDAAVTADTMGHALVTLTSHGLVDNNYIYVDSDIEDYNGLWQVDSITSSTFKIKRGNTFQPYVKPFPISFCKAETTTSWNAVHLPVVYEIESDVDLDDYSNYHAVVKVNAGIPVGNSQEYIKPYEVLTTLKLIPDNDNKIQFSIHEILKAHIKTRNNLLLSSLPNNTDFWTSFYISYAESYDILDGYILDTYISEYTDDSFVGYVSNSKLPFKSKFSGAMSEYVSNVDVPGKWLTNFQELRVFSDLYRDISFINTYDQNIHILYDGVLAFTLIDPGVGVLRVPIDTSTAKCITAAIADTVTGEEPIVLPPLNTWTNEIIEEEDTAWTLSSTPTLTLIGSGGESDSLTAPYDFIVGETYNFTLNITLDNVTSVFVNVLMLDSSFNIIGSDQTVIASSSGPQILPFTLIAPSGADYLGIRLVRSNSGVSTVNSISGTMSVLIEGDTYQNITQPICIVLDTSTSPCPNPTPPTYTYRITEDEFLRITEDGVYRITE